MGYYLYDENGFVADGPSITGLRKLRSHLTGPVGREFIETGFVTDMSALVRELAEIGAAPDDVKSSADALSNAAGRARGVLILSDGVG